MFDPPPPEPNSQEPATTTPARGSWLTTPNDEPPQGSFAFAAPPPRGSNVAFWSRRPPSFVPQHIPPRPGPATQIPTGCQPPALCERPQPGLIETPILETHPSATALRPQSQNFTAHQSPPVSHHESCEGHLHSYHQDSAPEEDPRVRERLQSQSTNVPIPPVLDCPEIRQQRPSEFDTNIRMEIMQSVVDAVNRFHALGKVERDLAGEEIEKLQGELRRIEGTLEITYQELDKKNKLLAERHAQLTEQEEQLAEQGEQLAEKDTVARERMAQCNEWKEKTLSAWQERDTLLVDIASLRSKLDKSQKLTENMSSKLREYKAKLNEAIDEQQGLYHRSLAYCDSATNTIQQEKNARASSASEVVMALEASRNKQAELREGYRMVCEELQRDVERKDEHIQQLEADLTNQGAELTREKQTSATLRSSIQENANIEVMKLLQDQQQLFLSKFDAISTSLSENRIKASDLTTVGDKFKDTILASILPEFQSLHAQQDAINATLEQEFEQESVSLEDLSVQLEEFVKRAGEIQGLRASLIVALQDAVEKSDALRKSQDEVIAALRIQVDGANGQVPVQQSVNTTLNQMAGPDGTSHFSRTLIGGADHDVGGPDSQPPYTPTRSPRDRKVIVSSPEKDSVSTGRPISVAEEQSRRRDASAPRPRSALRKYAGVTKPANSLSPSAPFTSFHEFVRRLRNDNN